MNALITHGDYKNKKQFGGIANFYRVLEDKFSFDPIHFIVGKRENEVKNKIFKKLIRIFHDYHEFNRTIKNKEIDLIILNPSLSWSCILRDAIFLLISAKRTKKAIVFFHGWHKYMENIINKYFKSLFIKIFNKSDAGIVLSRDFKKILRQWGYSKPVYIESMIVDDDYFKKPIIDKFRTQVSDSNNKIKILFLARLERSKGVFEMIETYKILKKIYCNLSLTIAGDGNAREEMINFVEKHNITDVKFTGFVTGEEKIRCFGESHIYLFPSSHGEGMPISVLEAMAFGLPVVTRPVGGINDFFEDKKMGFITESKDPGVFAKLVVKLIVNPELRREISLYNYQYAKEYFCASKVAKRLERIFEEVINS